MMRIVFLLFLSTYVIGHDQESLLLKYGMKKLYESCFGSYALRSQMDEYYTWMEECQEEVIDEYDYYNYGFIFPSGPLIDYVYHDDIGEDSTSPPIRRPAKPGAPAKSPETTKTQGTKLESSKIKSSKKKGSKVDDPKKEDPKESLTTVEAANPTPEKAKDTDPSTSLSNLLQLIKGKYPFSDKLSAILESQLPDRKKQTSNLEGRKEDSDLRLYYPTYPGEYGEPKNNTKMQIGLATCVLKKAGVLSFFDEIQWARLRDVATRHVPYNYFILQYELNTISETCMYYAPIEASVNPVDGSYPHNLNEVIAFFNCQEPRLITACMRKELQNKPESFMYGDLNTFMANYKQSSQLNRQIQSQFKFGTDFDDLFE